MAPLLHSSTKAEVGTKAETERLRRMVAEMMIGSCQDAPGVVPALRDRQGSNKPASSNLGCLTEVRSYEKQPHLSMFIGSGRLRSGVGKWSK